MISAFAAQAGTEPADRPRAHPRTIGWLGTTALAMGGSNQSLFLIAALIAGQGHILGQGSAAIPLLIVGLLLGWAAAPGWTELILIYPNRVGGIAAACAEAFRPYSAVLANLAGVCYWWGWVPTCGLTALFSAAAIHHWYLPGIPVVVLAISIVVTFCTINLCGIKWVTRLAVPTATISALLALVSGLVPILSGSVDWRQATTFDLTVPFPGWFGALTSMMAGLYLIGFAAPAFEAATCHVGETVDPNRNVPRAMLASALMAAVYFVLLPVVWLGVLGPDALGRDLALELGPTFAPLLGTAAKTAAIWFMMFNMFHGTLQPLAGATRTLAQLADDGLLPRIFGRRLPTDAPWFATVLTAAMAVLFLLIGDPIWLIAAANFTYLIGICLPNVAVWLLRRDAPDLHRPYRAPRGTIALGLIAAIAWACSALLGFQQFGLPTVMIGIVFAFAGAALYAWRKLEDRRRLGLPPAISSLHVKLTGAMLVVLVLDGIGYLAAVTHVSSEHAALVAALEDIFVAVAMMTITVGLVLPGMIAHSVTGLARAADRLATGTVADLARAMRALGRGDLEAAQADVDLVPLATNTRDEVGQMARSFNQLQEEIARAAIGLEGARDGLRRAREELIMSNDDLRFSEERLRLALEGAHQGSWDWNIAAGVLNYSDRTRAILGLPHDQAVIDIDAWERLVHPDDLDHVWRDFTDSVESGTGHYASEYRVKAGGGWRWVSDRGKIVQHDAVGQPIRAVGILADITEQRQVEEALIQAKVAAEQARREAEEARYRAEQADQVKTRFLAQMSHEIRTPLNAVLGFAGLLADSPLDPQQRQHLETVRETGHLLLVMLNDLLDYAKLEAGKISLERIPFRLDDLLDETRRTTEMLLSEKTVALRFELDSALPAWVRGDPIRLKQVLNNLLSNAVKFTAKGSITLGATVLPSPPHAPGSVRFAVTDTGIGVAKDQHGALFQEFSQIGDGTARHYGGTGLGLTICRELVELMGGIIGVDSDAGRGSTFWFTVSLDPVEAPLIVPEPAQRAAAKHMPPLRILVADDVLTNRELARALLERQGHLVTLAENGHQAVEAVRRQPPDVVLMDINMPVMDGIEAMRAIRALPGTVGKLPIIAMTANAFPADLQRFVAAGMNGHVTKPFDPASLTAAISGVGIAAPMVPDMTSPVLAMELLLGMDEAVGRATLRRLFLTMIRDVTAATTELADALARGDVEFSWKVAHRIKGIGGSLGVPRLSTIAGLIEARIKAGETDGCDALLTEMNALLVAAEAAFTRQFAELAPA